MVNNKSPNLQQAIENRRQIADIKRKFLSGEISHDEAKQLAKPIIESINKCCVEIARRQGARPYKLNFISLMRNSY